MTASCLPLINRITAVVTTAAALATWGAACGATEVIAPPPGGNDLATFESQESFQFGAKQAETTGEWVTIKNMPFDRAFRVNVATPPRARERAHLKVPVTGHATKGDAILLSFWIRRPRSGGEPGPATICIESGEDQCHYELKFSAYRKWQQHVRAFEAPADFDPQNTTISIKVDNSGRAIEVADLLLLSYGKQIAVSDLPRSAVSYDGRDPDAPWRAAALARIERIRKGDLTVEVVDGNGKPVKDATVKVEMCRHAFGFGNVVNSQLLGAPKDAFPYVRVRGEVERTSTWEDAQKYREIVENFFNYVTFESELRPHKWQEMTDGTPSNTKVYDNFLNRAVPRLTARDIGIRGHYLAWGAIDFNESERKYVGRPEAHRQWLWDHMADVLPKTAAYVTEWDTINHIIGWGKHTYEKEYGSMQIYAEIMEEARRLAPDARHAINEGKVLPNGYKREPYKRVIRFLNEQGQAPDSVGFMAHFELTSLTPPEELLEVYDDFGKIAPRLQLSEFDVETGDDEQLQADYYRDVMIASFSHPNFVSIVQWGFWENAHWKPAAGLWRTDWSLKPSGKVFVDLVKNQWWTDEVARTNRLGISKVRGFLGDYNVSVEHQGRSVTYKAVLMRGGTHVRIEIE